MSAELVEICDSIRYDQVSCGIPYKVLGDFLPSIANSFSEWPSLCNSQITKNFSDLFIMIQDGLFMSPSFLVRTVLTCIVVAQESWRTVATCNMWWNDELSYGSMFISWLSNLARRVGIYVWNARVSCWLAVKWADKFYEQVYSCYARSMIYGVTMQAMDYHCRRNKTYITSWCAWCNTLNLINSKVQDAGHQFLRQ